MHSKEYLDNLKFNQMTNLKLGLISSNVDRREESVEIVKVCESLKNQLNHFLTTNFIVKI